MKSSFHNHQIVYVKGIGYARLAIEQQKCTKNRQAMKTVVINDQNEAVQLQLDQQTDVLLFDPDMFNIDTDSPFGDCQVQLNLAQFNTRKNSIQVSRKASTQLKSKQLIIVPLKLEQTNAMLYCPETYLMKKVKLSVKSLLQNNMRQIQLNVEITKTIDNLRNLIFIQLGQQAGYYTDIRIFTNSPRFQELNIGSKTIWQCQLKHKCRITIAAKFNFTFKALPQGKQTHFTLSNVKNTVCQLVPVPKKQQVVINTTIIINTTTQTPKIIEQKVIKFQQSKAQQLVETVLKQQTPQKSSQQTEEVQNNKQKSGQKQTLHLQCIFFIYQINAKFRSGTHYWQIRIDKLQTNKQSNSILIGVCLKSEQQSAGSEFMQLWGYDPIKCKRVQMSNIRSQQSIPTEKQQQQNGSDQSDEEYRSTVKIGDFIGVLLTIKQKKASLVFYKNSICFQECCDFNVQELKSRQHKNSSYLCPFVSLSGQVQLTLDSKASHPLDSYRFK